MHITQKIGSLSVLLKKIIAYVYEREQKEKSCCKKSNNY